MYLAAALAAHNVLAPRQGPVPGPSLPLVSEDAIATALDGSAIDSDDEIPTPSLSSTASFCSSDRSSSFDAHPFASQMTSSIYSSTSSQSSSAPSFKSLSGLRKNEHLAVLLSKDLWKPDSQAEFCEIIPCHRKFTMLERKHHCRKCGGVFCGACSSRYTELLDTTNLDFLHPPRRVPISSFASPQSPVIRARVCDDCYIQIHGLDGVKGGSEYVNARRDSAPSLPPSPCIPSSSRSMRRTESSSIPPRQRRQSTKSESQSSVAASVKSSSSSGESSLGDLSYYPLRVHSSVCKATGGGRWSPKPVRNWDGHRIPGGKALFEVAMERAAEKERLRKVNPLIRDGEFQLRQPRAPERIDRWKPTEVLSH